jgi:hypothetical protein
LKNIINTNSSTKCDKFQACLFFQSKSFLSVLNDPWLIFCCRYDLKNSWYHIAQTHFKYSRSFKNPWVVDHKQPTSPISAFAGAHAYIHI